MNLVANVLIFRAKCNKLENPLNAFECQKESPEFFLRANHHLEMAFATYVARL